LIACPARVTTTSEIADRVDRTMAKRVRVVATIVACAVAAVLFAQLVAHADRAATLRAIRSSGPLVGLALAPFVLGTTIDAYGMVVLLRARLRSSTPDPFPPQLPVFPSPCSISPAFRGFGTVASPDACALGVGRSRVGGVLGPRLLFRESP
jgi:hypothetical protein